MARMNNPGRTFAAYGDSASHNVRELQQVLRQLGVYSGAVTGMFDDATYQAYRQACRAAHLPISRDKKGRLVVTLGDFEALEQLDAGAVDFAAAETQVEAEDDFAKRPVDASELEEDSAKYPVAADSGKSRRRRWVVLLAALGVVVAAAVILATRPTRDADDPQQAAPIAPTATAVPTAATVPTSNPQDFEISITGNKTCSITGYTGNDTQLEIPSTIQGYTVTAIGNSAFAYCDSLTSITIPGSVWVIGDSAFFNCDSLTSITIPDSVTTIGNYAFSNCDSLTSITIPDSVTTIGNSAFSNCDSLTSITIPDSVTTIGNYAFFDCTSLTSITIPDSVTTIGTNPFSGCDNLTDIIVSPDHPTLTTTDGVLFDKVEKALICYPRAYTNSSYIIPEGTRFIAKSAFAYCDSLTSITIPDSVTYIGVWAFEDCESLTAVYVTENSYAHQYCIDNNLPYVLQ